MYYFMSAYLILPFLPTKILIHWALPPIGTRIVALGKFQKLTLSYLVSHLDGSFYNNFCWEYLHCEHFFPSQLLHSCCNNQCNYDSGDGVGLWKQRRWRASGDRSVDMQVKKLFFFSFYLLFFFSRFFLICENLKQIYSCMGFKYMRCLTYCKSGTHALLRTRYVAHFVYY